MAIKQKKVLVVEDDETVRKIVPQFLRHCGFNLDLIETVENVEFGKAVIRSHKVDLIVTDFDLPDGTGVDIMRAARDQYAGTVAIILMSGKLERNIADHREILERLRPFGTIEKPFLINALKAVLESQGL